MRRVHGLLSIALASFLSINSGVAMGRGIEQVPNPTSSDQTEPMIMADFFRDIQRTIQTIDQVNQIRLREERRQELEAARQAATEQQRLETERRRQYFESLSPEQKEAFLAEQRARREQADQSAALFLMMLFQGSSDSASGSEDGRTSTYRCVAYFEPSINDWRYEDRQLTAAEARSLNCN
jgi:hypothetical protein